MLRILLAEDSGINQRIALMALRGLGYQADVAADGIEVLKALERKSYDVILMDVHMPELDGLKTTQRIRLNPTLYQPYIIALTATAKDEDHQDCLAAGMNAYLEKPIRPKTIAELLKQVEQVRQQV
jgi:CheY-like chemotaxis protein